MKLTARGGTDAAGVVLFCPASMPADADAQIEDDPAPLIDQLQREGKLVWFPCDSDGGYRLSVYIDEAIPADLGRYAKEERALPVLTIVGDAYFGGIEYVFAADDGRVQRYPHMCTTVAIPAGDYSGSVYSVDTPENVRDAWLLGRAGVRRLRVHRLHNVVAALAVFGVATTAVSVCFLPWAFWCGFLAISVTLAALAFVLLRSDAVKAVAAADRDFEEAFPDYVVHLRSTGHAG
jgi:hypothetical protein